MKVNLPNPDLDIINSSIDLKIFKLNKMYVLWTDIYDFLHP